MHHPVTALCFRRIKISVARRATPSHRRDTGGSLASLSVCVCVRALARVLCLFAHTAIGNIQLVVIHI